MSDLTLPVKNGTAQTSKTSTTNSSKNTTKKNELGKDAFLQLLATQMKYQDPMNPSNDTQFVAQLATFSQLEQMQNLSTVTANSQAFSLVGKNVTVKTESTAGNTTYVSGKVDSVNMAGTKAQLSINGTLYPIDQLDRVVDENYLIEQNRPGVSGAVELNYDAFNPKDLAFDVKLGTNDTVADKVAVAINDQILDASLVKLSGNKVTIDSSALAGLENGTYKVAVAFNDSLKTIVKDKVTLQVQNAIINNTDSLSTVASTDTTSTTDTTQQTVTA